MNDKIFHQHLLDTGLVTAEQLETARSYDPDLFIEESLEKLGIATVTALYEEMSKTLGLPLVDLNQTMPSVFAVRLVLPRVLRQYEVIPINCDDEVIEIATACPGDFNVLDAVRFACDREVVEHLARRRQINDALNDLVGGGETHKEVEVVSADEIARREAKAEEEERLKQTNFLAFDEVDAEKEAATVINQLLKNAIFRKASDIHFEPRPDGFHIRDRIDGELHLVSKLHHSAGRIICSRLKVLSKMNIAEKQKPQDGSFTVTSKGNRTDLRLSSMPTPYGEKIVIRFLDPNQGNIRLEQIGLLPDTAEKIKELIVRPQGLVIVTGPTGSGKSSTLCSIINTVKSEDINIISIEDPVEYKIKGVNQIGVNIRQGVTFASGLKAILRQDPDIIYVGEIRDAETAVTAIQAAQTGHMVFTTLHTNDSVSAITRLTNMGIPGDMIADALTAVLAQRLTRRVCQQCAKPVQPNEQEKKYLESVGIPMAEWNLRRATGCAVCYHRGYAGRICVNELLLVDDKMRELIIRNSGAMELWKYCQKQKMRTLWQTAVVLVGNGTTTLEEVGRNIPESTAETAEEVEARTPTEERELEDVPAVRPPPVPEPKVRDPESPVVHGPDTKSAPEPRAESKSTPATELTDNGIPRKILIVDDEPAVRRLLEKGLKMFDAEIFTATNGDAAINSARENLPDLIISDIHMPNCDGLSLCKKLLEDPTTKGIPIIILTGDASVEVEIQSFEIGAIDFIRKPIRVPALLARVKALFKRTRVAG